MGHKVHPVGIRLGHVRTHDGQWQSTYHYTDLVLYEQRLRRYMRRLCEAAQVLPGRVIVRVGPKQCLVQPMFTEVQALPEKYKGQRIQKGSKPRYEAPPIHHLHDGCGKDLPYNPMVMDTPTRGLATLVALWMGAPGFSHAPAALISEALRMQGKAPEIGSNLAVSPQNLLSSGPLLKYLRTRLSSVSGVSMDLRPCRSLDPYESASFVAGSVAMYLESGLSLRQIFRGLLHEVRRRSWVRGLRIRCSGRLQGAEIARVESRKEGQTPLHVFSRRVDFATSEAYTQYGIIGVKVWICYHTLRKK